MGEPRTRDATSPPDGGWGWVVVFASFMIHIFADGVIFSFGVYHNELVKYFKSSEAATSLISSILVGFTLCVGPVSSALVNRYGCRVVAAGGGVVGALGIISSAFASNIISLQITIGVISGTGLGLIYLPATVAVTSYFRKKRALATGISVCGSGLGTFIMAPVTQWLVGEFGWRGAISISGALTLHCMVFGLLFRPLQAGSSVCQDMHCHQNGDKKEEKTRSHSLGYELNGYSRLSTLQFALKYNIPKCGSLDFLAKEESPKETSNNKPLNNITNISSEAKPLMVSDSIPRNSVPVNSLKNATPIKKLFDLTLFKEPVFLIFALSNFCTALGFNVPFVYTVSHAEAKGVPKRVGSYLISIIGIANTSGRIILGYFFDKNSINRQWIYNCCLIIGGLSTALSTLCYNMAGFILYAVTFGFTVGAYAGLTSVIVVDFLGLDKLSDVYGFLLLFQGLANLLGPPITGWLHDSTKSYTPGFLVAGTVISVSGLILFALPTVQRYGAKLKKRENPEIGDDR